MNNMKTMPCNKRTALNKWLLVAILMGMQISIVQSATAAQCFSDPRTAYAYLMSQEKNAKQVKLSIEKSRKVNINTATEAELTSLTGIGSKKAQAIILYRDGFGRFDSVDDLTKVKGIGEKTVEKNRSRLTVY